MCLYAEQKLVAERNNNPLYMWKIVVVKAKTENKEEHKYFSPFCCAEWKLPPSSMYMKNTVLYSYDKYPLASCEAVITNGNDLVDADYVITMYTNRKLLTNGFFHGYSSLKHAYRGSREISLLDKDFIIIVRYVCIGLSAIGHFIASNDSVVSSSILYDGIEGFIPAYPYNITKAMKQYGKNLNEIFAETKEVKENEDNEER